MPDLVPIGDAARLLGLRPSTLRYYDERGLVAPAARVGGRRLYGPDELRRVAFLTLARRLGIPSSSRAGRAPCCSTGWTVPPSTPPASAPR